jgi:hypothetical protein
MLWRRPASTNLVLAPTLRQSSERGCHMNLAPAERESKGSALLFQAASPPANAETLRLLRGRSALRETRWRWTLNAFWTAAWTDRIRCAGPGDLNRCIFRSRRRTGRCEFSALPVASRQSRFGLRCGLGTQLVSHQHVGRGAVPFEQLAHQFHRRSLVASPLHQQIENLAFVVDRSPESESPAGDQNCHLVQMPVRGVDDVCGEVPWRTTARTSTPIV